MHRLISDLFNRAFYEDYKTRLVGGMNEPFYRAPRAGRDAVVYYRQNYVSSALHEIAHWCIAGADRRLVDDYGYWYEPDGRNAEQQLEFEHVEVKPQALELLCSKAVGVPFQVSADNLESNILPNMKFAEQVSMQAREYSIFPESIPERARTFLKLLEREFSESDIVPTDSVEFVSNSSAKSSRVA